MQPVLRREASWVCPTYYSFVTSIFFKNRLIILEVIYRKVAKIVQKVPETLQLLFAVLIDSWNICQNSEVSMNTSSMCSFVSLCNNISVGKNS